MDNDPLTAIQFELVRVNSKLDALLERAADHETRIRSCEKWQYGIPAAILSSLAALAATLVLK